MLPIFVIGLVVSLKPSEVSMDKVLPIIIICCVGIGLAFAYIVFVLVRALMQKRHGTNPRNEFEIDDNTLIVKLGKKRKKK